VYFFSSAGRIACKDVGIFEAFSCPWPLSPTFDTLREIERASFSPVPWPNTAPDCLQRLLLPRVAEAEGDGL
jgi:hypothetical protein